MIPSTVCVLVTSIIDGLIINSPEKLYPWQNGQRVSELGSCWTHWRSFPRPPSSPFPVSRINRSLQDRHQGWYQDIDLTRHSGAIKCLSKFSLRYISEWPQLGVCDPRTYLGSAWPTLSYSVRGSVLALSSLGWNDDLGNVERAKFGAESRWRKGKIVIAHRYSCLTMANYSLSFLPARPTHVLMVHQLTDW